jgi:hypothetical protein
MSHSLHSRFNLFPSTTSYSSFVRKMSSSKRKWDDAPADAPVKAAKTDETKTASEAAAAAAAIAAKIAASFAGGPLGSLGGDKDPHDADFTHDIDINDVRNRYMLTKGSTQTDVRI